MAEHTKIEWTDRTWNPVRGCSRVSEGCRNCYAERQAMRFSGEGQYMRDFVRGGKWTGRVELVPQKLDEPMRWRKPQRVFVNSMSDLFHESLGFWEVDRVFAMMSRAPKHTFQVLTKRPERMRAYMTDRDRPARILRLLDDRIESHEESARLSRNWPWPLPNVWLGVSVEDQATADARIPVLLDTPAAVRFVIYEPALGPVDFGRYFQACCGHGRRTGEYEYECCGQPVGLDWLIIGGESGPGARPCDVAWVRSAVEQCAAAGVACFVKQLGSYPVDTSCDSACVGRKNQNTGYCPMHTTDMRGCVESRKGGDPSEWPEALRVREFPAQPPKDGGQ